MLALENVVAIREVVVRPLPAYFGPLQGVRGVATFEDGRAMPVLDLEDLPLDDAIALRPKGELDESSTDADVLIVDDSLSVRRAVAEVLGEAGMRTTMARDGLEAMAILQKQRPRVVVADLEMPRINGLELTAHIRRTPELTRLPVLLLTSRMGRRHRAMAHTVGVNRIMFKPYDPIELVDTVSDLAGMSDNPRIVEDENPSSDLEQRDAQ
jgi:chemosensory pili system protein ChpA (sensor histidine kinase/response regulator)